MTRTKVRFNLGRGPNYMKWKVESKDGIFYYDPEEVSLVMTGCTLKNYKKTAEKIYNGGEKVVCAWVLCNDLIINNIKNDISDKHQIKYNPRITPNWTLNGDIVDNNNYCTIWSSGRKLFTDM
jgi:hypothetical protein